MEKKDIHYLGLDLLRFFAAWLVVFDHFSLYSWEKVSAEAQGDAVAFPFLHGMGNIGSIGVEIFFLISGFVIVMSAKGVTAKQFILNRGIRVFPALWLCGLIALVARAMGGEPLTFLMESFFRSAVLSPIGPYIDGVVWTLIVEAVFYFLIFIVLYRNSFSRLESIARILGAVSAVFVSLMAAAIFLAYSFPFFEPITAICGRFPFKVFLLRHGVFFALGIFLWLCFDSGFTRARIKWMVLLSAFCSIEIWIDRDSLAGFLVPLLLWWASLATILVSVSNHQWISLRLKPWKGVVKDMGRLSYPLYLNHYSFGMVLVPALFSLNISRPWAFALSIFLVAFTSYLIVLYPERAMQSFLKSRLGMGRARTKDVTAGADAREA